MVHTTHILIVTQVEIQETYMADLNPTRYTPLRMNVTL